ncbi:hypothetical protein Tco_1412235, partial [Tanacetum coccineum]
MIGDRSQLTNFVNKFLVTVKFRNDHVAKILGYGDYQIGNVTISRVYYMEGLGHNLFFVGGQSVIRDLEGLVPNPPPSTPFEPPLRTDWDILFQPLFDELLNPSSSVDHPAPEFIAPIAEVVAPEPAASISSPSSTTVDQDAPSPSNSQKT